MAHGDITRIDIPVNDLGKAQEFYSGLFGWQISTPPGFEDYPLWMAPNKISGGGLVSRDQGMSQPLSYAEVDSIDDTLAKVTENGGSVVVEKSTITETRWYACFTDPDGNLIGIYEGVTDVSQGG